MYGNQVPLTFQQRAANKAANILDAIKAGPATVKWSFPAVPGTQWFDTSANVWRQSDTHRPGYEMVVEQAENPFDKLHPVVKCAGAFYAGMHTPAEFSAFFVHEFGKALQNGARFEEV